jgi:anthranilate synthase component 1
MLKNNKNFLITKTITADVLTPVSALLKLQKISKQLCLLESVTGGEKKGRFSVIAILPKIIWKCENEKSYVSENSGKSFKLLEDKKEKVINSLNLFLEKHKIDDLQNLPSIACGAFGYMGYDMIKFFENIPNTNPKNLNIPDSVYFIPEITIIFDNISDTLTISTPIFNCYKQNIKQKNSTISKIEKILFADLKLSKPKLKKFTPNFKTHISKENFYKIVEKSKQYIKAGDIFQIVPSRRFSSPFPLPTTSFYRSLRSINPSPYMFYFQYDDFVIAGSSPEIMVRLKGDKVTIRPIAGTRKRGKDEAEDLFLEKDLLQDKKELAEHLMLLDLGRNDTSRVCEASSVKVTEKMIVEKYSHVMHIVSNVEGKIKKGKNALDALIAGFPAGTVSGAPKVRAMEIINQLEIEKRQFYAGTIGYISANGDMDTAIMLRTALIKDKKIYIQAGGGVVYDSTSKNEFEETHNKAKALMKATENAINYW